MTEQVVLDVARVVNDLLRDNDFRAVNKRPDETGAAWVQTTMLNAGDGAENIDHLITYLLQAECYASADNGPPEAFDAAVEVRRLLKQMPGLDLPIVVTKVKVSGPAMIPDEGMTPWRQRGVLTVQVWARQ